MKEDRVFRGWLLSQLKSADFGVVDVRMEEMTMTVSSNFIGEISDEGNDIDKPETFYRLSLLHRGTGGDFAIPVHRESRGTQRLLDLAPVLYDLAHDDNPKAVFIDEIHESLHPTLLQALLGHFNCDIPMIEVCGQLIFATHETFLMDAEAKNAVLRRDQIYLTEKDTAGAARLYSVAEFRERNNLNIRRRYLQGRYGALPALGSFS
jgi:AAA15 family ATPase/GTPase